MTVPQELADYDRFLAAGASATPQSFLVSAADAFKRGQSTKRLSSYINDLGHDDL